MLRYTNIENKVEREAFLAQVADYARVLTTRLTAIGPNDNPCASQNAVYETEEHARISCQLVRYVHLLAADEKITPEEANRVSLFVARILEAIAGAGDSLSLQRIAKSVKKLSVWSPDWASMIRVARTIDPLVSGRDFHFWASLARNTIPALEWVDDAVAPVGGVLLSTQDLTMSQHVAVKKLGQFLDWQRSRQTVAGIWLRPIPLLIGPTGAGKTTVVQSFCSSEGLAYMHFNPSAWVIVGAYSKPWTLHEIRNFVNIQDAGVIFIDELDKFCGNDGSWDRHLTQELMSLLDHRIPESAGWSACDRSKLAERFLIIGTGTWQSDHRQNTKTMGFGSANETQFTLDAGTQKSIPEELLRRFNPNLIYIEPPTKGEVMQRVLRIHAELKQAAPSRQHLEELGRQAVASGENTRWLEGYLARVMDQSTDFGREQDRIAHTK